MTQEIIPLFAATPVAGALPSSYSKGTNRYGTPVAHKTWYSGPDSIWAYGPPSVALAGSVLGGVALISADAIVPVDVLLDGSDRSLVSYARDLMVITEGWVNAHTYAVNFRPQTSTNWRVRFAMRHLFAGLPGTVGVITEVQRLVLGGGQKINSFSVSAGSLDNFGSNDTAQSIVTFVPHDVAANVLGAPVTLQSYGGGTTTPDVAFESPMMLGGGTLYVQAGRLTMAAAQDYIAADLQLIESTPEVRPEYFFGAPPAALDGGLRGVSSLFSTDPPGAAFLQAKQMAAPPGFGAFKGVVEGVVSVLGVPASRLVRIYAQQGGEFIDAQWSAADGSYRFTNLQEGRDYFVISHDYQRTYTAVAKDRIRL